MTPHQIKRKAQWESEHAQFMIQRMVPLPRHVFQRVDKSIIYFIQRASGGDIKIGITIDLQTRLSTLQTAHSEPLACLATLDGGAYEEGMLHERFAEHRLHGAWFRP